MESTSRKRSHHDFAEHEAGEPTDFQDTNHLDSSSDKENNVSLMPPERLVCSPMKSSPGLTASGSSPLDGNSPSPNLTSNRVLCDSAVPAPVQKLPLPQRKKAKRSKQDPEETKLQREKERELKKQEAEKQREIKRQEVEKKKQEEKDKKAAERVAKKEAEKKKKDEENAKKMRSQPKLTNMGITMRNSSTPQNKHTTTKPDENDTNPTGTSSKVAVTSISAYDQLFKPFFVKENVTVAKIPYEMDEETREVKSEILSEYVEGKRGEVALNHTSLLEALKLPFPSKRRRGRVYPSVKKIMAEYHELSSLPVDLTTKSQNEQIQHTLEALRAVPVKSLKFKEDVRPPYVGTISGLPAGVKSLRPVARNPISKNILPLDYDYDSEAEWQEEDGEDVDELDDEDDDMDIDEDMDGFLDDSDDIGPARLVFSGGMEPECTGLCWENRKRLNSPARVYKYRMEFILESLDHHSGIDPFSDLYWKSAADNEPSTASESAPATIAGSCLLAASNIVPNPMASSSTTNGPKALTQGIAAGKKSPMPLPREMHDKLINLMKTKPALSKVGIIELFASEEKCSKIQIKASFDLLAESTGKRGKNAKWKLKDDV
ncbi:chromatin assembly factor 1 subunit A-domain-containing protein [Lasiosphaeris hirsuta]|uniref:Chromatin assembly factor 1 subunit A-domain-containing protein n=1 Tax=Lasiosphaeris hirsuta TaxID=260670 RepID=A0AA40E018_9PEZI|nr:chromatin assembly factor 1 subunit A-domain-containing protein [Lasiosphaeris hirsuta]